MVPSSRTGALSRLRHELDEAADALRHANLPRLLAAETQLHDALAALTAQSSTIRGDATALPELRAIQASLATCRRLGTAMTGVIELSLAQMRDEPAIHTFQHSA